MRERKAFFILFCSRVRTTATANLGDDTNFGLDWRSFLEVGQEKRREEGRKAAAAAAASALGTPVSGGRGGKSLTLAVAEKKRKKRGSKQEEEETLGNKLYYAFTFE
jgi:hypothetical protein